MLWALVETENKCVARKFIVVGTGTNIDAELGLRESLYLYSPSSYVDTFQVEEHIRGVHTSLVFHVFEIPMIFSYQTTDYIDRT